MKKLKQLLVLSALFIAFTAQKCKDDPKNEANDCGTKIPAQSGSSCGISEFRLETPNSYPNPVSNGGTAKIRAVVGAINQMYQPIPISITIKIYGINGQLVNTSIYTPQQTLAAQEIPLWANINAAAGIYSVQIVVNKGVCGSEKVCFNKITVI